MAENSRKLSTARHQTRHDNGHETVKEEINTPCRLNDGFIEGCKVLSHENLIDSKDAENVHDKTRGETHHDLEEQEKLT